MQAGFVDVKIEIKQNAEAFIKDWMPGSGAEKVITSVYVTASKPVCHWGFRDDVRAGKSSAEIALPQPKNEPAGSGEQEVSAGC